MALSGPGSRRPVAPTLPNYDFVDAHTHPYDRAHDGSLVYSEEWILKLLPEQGIGLAITMIRDTLENQYEQLDDLCRRNPWLVPIVWVHPKEHSLKDTEWLVTNGGFQGMKMHPTTDGYLADTKIVDPFFELAGRHGLSVQIHSATDDPSRPHRIASVAKRHPEVPVVLVHAELGALRKQGAIDAVKDVPNVYVETSWTNAEEITRIIKTLGSHRVLFGTDSTVDGCHMFTNTSIPSTAGEYRFTIPHVMATLKETLPKQDFANWARDTAIRLYRLPLPR